MTKPSRYTIRDTLHTTSQYLIQTASLSDSSNSFLIKSLTHVESNNESLAQMQHEYYLLEKLNAVSAQFPKISEFIEHGTSHGIVLIDEGYRPLETVLPQKQRSIENFFAVAIEITKAVATIHKTNIIHKHLIPQNIFYHPTEHTVQIYDFSIATELNRTMVPTDPPRLLQGTLEYMAPEQTGRMNRPLTQRADLYSLGIIFYEWLTGSVPFKAKEPMTIIFGHIATIPKSPQEIDKKIPSVLSDMVMKLLSKPAEERYKSALGLLHDLEAAYAEYKETKNIAPFPLATEDIATQLELPEKLYGREEQTRALFQAFDTLCNTQQNQLITVSGYSGIGKTSLVRELISKIALAKGFFATGKFDKFQQSDTYEGLRNALDKVVRYHLSLPEAEYQVFKHTLLSEMGGILPVVTEFIPRLITIVGAQEAPDKLSIEATRNRFELAIRRFIKITSLHHPFVLFLDDVQWANQSMFTLLQKIVISDDIKNLLLILSYRSNEIDDHHPLLNFLEQVGKKQSMIDIKATGLTEDALNQLLQDMLYLPKKEVESLTHLIHKKTEGNPFFLLMLLEELYREEELIFDSTKNRWLWDETKILTMAASDNVLDFVANRIEKLPTHIKEVLHLAACVGNTFILEELALAEIGHVPFLAESLQTAIQAGFILPTKLTDEWVKGVAENELLNREYRFQHDKIQQSCYEIKSIEESKKVHLHLARHWYKEYQDKLSTTRLMAIADQFDKGLSYIADLAEKNIVCQLNYQAGEAALQSAAYETAYQYNSMAKSLLGPKSWQNNYTLIFGVFLNYIKSAFLSHHFTESEKASEEALQKANNNFDKATLLHIRGNLSRVMSESGLTYYEEGLRLLGHADVAIVPSLLQVLWSVTVFKFYISHDKKSWQDLEKEVAESVYLSAILSERIAEDSFYRGNVLRYAYAITKYFTKTFSFHNAESRALAYVVYIIIWPQNKISHTLYNKAQEILPHANNKELAVAFYFAASALHLPWHTPFKDLGYYFQKAYELGEQAGSLEFSAQSYIYIFFSQMSVSLKGLLPQIARMQNQISSTSKKGYIRLMMQYAFVEYLTTPLQSNSSLLQDKLLEFCREDHYPLGEYAFYAHKLSALMHTMQSSILFKDRVYLWQSLARINKSNIALFVLPINFYLFILEAEAYSTFSIIEKIKSRVRLYSIYRRMKSWVKLCPENFLPYFTVIKAEYQRLKGHFGKALTFYDEAIRISKEFSSNECLSFACQRALTYCVQKNKQEMAKPYADMAVNAYAAWGADTVVTLLKEKYRELLSTELIKPAAAPVIELSSEQKEKQEERERYALDVRSIILAADVISKEIKLQGLLDNVMRLLVENIGATKSALCLMQKGSLWVEGFYDKSDPTIKTLTHTHWQEADLSQEVLLTAWRERKEVILLDVSLDTELNAGEYFSRSKTKCLIAAPIIRGDHVVGVIYCENNITTNAFTPERIDILRALAIQMSIAVENSRLYTTFEKFVPKPFLSQLGQEFIFDIEQGDSIEKHMNVLFMDIRNFTRYSEDHSANEAFRFINDYLAEVIPSIHSHHGFVDKFMGDGIMALFPTSSDEALQACLDMQQHIHQFAKQSPSTLSLKVGMALHYGPLMLGIVGERQHMEGTVIGDTVNVAARLESFNKLYGSDCLISDSLKKRLLNPAHYELRQVGRITLLGRKEPTAIWQVLNAIEDETLRTRFTASITSFEEAYHYYLEKQFDIALQQFQRIYKDNPQDVVAQFYSQYCQIYQKNPPPPDWQGEIEMTIK